MKKILKMITSFSLALAVIFSCNACFASATPGGGGGNGGGTGNVVIGGGRPNYDDMFDYDSGYVQPDLDPNKMITLTMDPNSPIKFAGGSDTLVIKTRSKLEQGNFDVSKLADPTTFLGIAEKNEKGEFTKARDFENYSVPYNDVTVLPYFKDPEGYSHINLGSGTGDKFNAASTSGSFKTSGTLKFIENAIVSGGEGYMPVKGGIISETSKVTMDSAFRIDSSFTVVKDTVYEFVYNFCNLSDKSVYFNLYQVSGGTDSSNRYRIDVDLKPGQSATYIGQYKLGANGNFLTYMVADDDMDNVKLAISAAVKATELKEPETINKLGKNTLTLAPGFGLTFEDGTTEKEVLENDPLPVIKGGKASEGYVIGGWYNFLRPNQFWNATPYELRDKGTGTTGVSVSPFKMPIRRTTIAPFYTKADLRPLIAASGNGIDNAGADCIAKRSTVMFDTDIGKQLGAVIDFSTPAFDGTPATGSKKGMFRLSTNCAQESKPASPGVLPAGTHRFYFTFINMGEQDLKFIAHQVISMTNLIPGADTGEITLKPGESWTGSIEVTLTAINNNALTIIKVLEDVTDAKLGILMWKSPSVIA